MTSQLVIFRAFLFIFFPPPTLDLKKIPVNQLIKKSGLNFNAFYLMALGVQKNGFIGAVLLSTCNICFGWEIKNAC